MPGQQRKVQVEAAPTMYGQYFEAAPTMFGNYFVDANNASFLARRNVSQSVPTGRSIAKPDWLEEALEDLDDTVQDAAADGIRVKKATIKLVKTALKHLAETVFVAPIIDVFPDKSVAIDFRSDHSDAVMFVCDHDGSGVLFENLKNAPAGRLRYDEFSFLIDAVGWSALKRANLIRG